VVYHCLAILTLLLHLLWILFIVCGFVLALKGSKLAFIHLGGLLLSLVVNLFGWYCPLTYLENYLYHFQDRGLGYNGSFIAHHLERLIYPNVAARTIRVGGIAFVVVNLIAYIVLLKKHLRKFRTKTRRPTVCAGQRLV
jgi:hypothetical protein